MLRFIPLLATLVLSMPTVAHALGRYVLTDINFASEPRYRILAWDLNEFGQVSGTAEIPAYEAFLWTPTVPNGTSGSMSTLGQLPNSHFSFGTGLNSLGQVVGGTGSRSPGDHGFLWSPAAPNGHSGSMVDLGSVSGNSDLSFAMAINSHGQIVGEIGAFFHQGGKAFLWNPNTPNGDEGEMINLGTASNATRGTSIARDINETGQVVGGSHTGPRGYEAFVWTPDEPNGAAGSMVALDNLPAESNTSTAFGISDYGQVTGYLQTDDGIRAFLWTPATPNGVSGSAVNLGLLPGHDGWSLGNDLNSHGHVVGYSYGSDGFRAFIWIPDATNGSSGTMLDLNDLMDPVTGAGWTLRDARGINDFGQIVGFGTFDPDGPGGQFPVDRSFLLTPVVPEPSAIWLALMALMLVAFAARTARRPAS